MYEEKPLKYQDQLNRQISIPVFPQRIVSLVPSQTELLADLGLNESVVGITKFCVHPHQWFGSKTRVGGTKQLNFKVIDRLQPDLIIGNKEENERGQIETLMEDYPVWMSDVENLDDALEMILTIGEITGKTIEAKKIMLAIESGFRTIQTEFASKKPLKVAYLIWRRPWMAAASGTFIDEMLKCCRLENVFGNQNRYPEISIDQLRHMEPDYIFLSSEPYPFKEKHIAEIECVCPDSKLLLVDGEMFSWYGSRLLKAVAYFRRLRNELELPEKI